VKTELMHTATPQQVAPQWLRTEAAETYSGLGRSTLTRLINAGELKAAKVGRSIRISRTSIDKYMEQQLVSGDGS
jgi:excisionase family DNA binding protein